MASVPFGGEANRARFFVDMMGVGFSFVEISFLGDWCDVF